MSATPTIASGRRRPRPVPSESTIGRRSSSSRAISATARRTSRTPGRHGEPLGEEEVRLAKRFYGWPEDAKFLVPDGVYEHFARDIGARGKSCGRMAGTVRALSQRPSRARRPMRSDAAARAARGLGQGHSDLSRRCQGHRHRDSSAQVLNAIARVSLADRWLRRPAPSTKTRLTFEGAGDLEADNLAAATFISASASTRWARSATAWR